MDEEKKSNRRSGSFGSTSKVQFEDDEDVSKQKLSLSEGSIDDKAAIYATSPGSEPSPSGTLKKPKRFRPKKFIQKRLRLRPKDSKSTDTINQTERADSEMSEDSIRKSHSFSSSRTSEKGSNPTSPMLQRLSFMKKITGGRKSYKVGSEASTQGAQETQDTSITLTKVEHIASSGEDQKSGNSSDSDANIAAQRRSYTPSDKFFEIKEQKEESTLSEETTTFRQTTLERKKQELKITISGKKVERIDKASSASPPSMSAKEQLENILLPAFAKNRRELSMERDEPAANPISSEVASSFPLTFAAVVREEPVDSTSRSSTSGSTRELEKYLVLTSSLNSIISAAKELDEQTTNKRISFQELIGTSKIEDFDNNLQHGELLRSESSPSPATVDSPDSATRDQVIEQIAQESEPNVEEKFAQLLESSPEPEEEQPKSISEAFTNFLKDQIHIEPELVSSTPKIKSMSSSDDEEKPAMESKSLSSSPIEQTRTEIKFEVGTPVRPQRTSPASSRLGLAPIAFVDELDISHEQPTAADDDDETFQSPMSDRSDKSLQSFRRKIRYVPEFSNYSADEQELLKSNLVANAADSPPDSSLFPNFDDTASVRILVAPPRTCATMC